MNTTLRERLGGTYGVSVRNAVTSVPTEIAAITVNWTCDPARVDELVEEVLKAVNALRTSEVPPPLVAAQADLMARQLDQSNRQNAAVASRIALNAHTAKTSRNWRRFPPFTGGSTPRRFNTPRSCISTRRSTSRS